MISYIAGSGGDVLDTKCQDTVGGSNDGIGGLELSLHPLSQTNISHYHKRPLLDVDSAFNTYKRVYSPWVFRRNGP
jgi:hypothetical protein